MDRLPTDAKKIISSFLDDRSRRVLRLASTEWSNIINYDYFTVYFVKPTTMPDLVKTFSRYSKPIGLRFEKTISMDNSFNILSSLTNLTSLEIEPNHLTEAGHSVHLPYEHLACLTTLTNLQRLDICLANRHISSVIQHFQQLTEVQILLPWNYREYSPEDALIFTKLGNHVKSLTVCNRNGHTLQLNEEVLAKMSKVSQLSFANSVVNFPFNKLPNLESLDIYGTEFDDFSVLSKLTSLTIHENQAENQPRKQPHKIAEQLSKLQNLKHLDLDVDLTIDELGFIGKLNKLESLTVQSIANSGKYLQLVKSPNLTSLYVTETIHSAEYISHLTGLQRLEYMGDDQPFVGSNVRLPHVTRLKSQGIAIAELCPNVKELTVQELAVANADEILASLVHLEQLNPVTVNDSALQVIFQLTRLTNLVVQLQSYDVYDFKQMKNLTGLKCLDLTYHLFTLDTDAIELLERTIGGFTNLEKLKINHFSESFLQRLEGLSKLKHLHLYTHQLKGLSATKLSNLTNLQTLQWEAHGGNSMTSDNLNLPYLYKHFSLT